VCRLNPRNRALLSAYDDLVRLRVKSASPWMLKNISEVTERLTQSAHRVNYQIAVPF
jgi:hypothetical protein